MTVRTVHLKDYKAHISHLQVDMLRRLPGVVIVGMSASEVRESAEHVRSALVASGCEFPRKRIVMNLAPSGERHAGSIVELAMAVGVLEADEQLKVPEDHVFVGGLSLSGNVTPCRGLYLAAELARSKGLRLLANVRDLPDDANLHGIAHVESLSDVIAYLRGQAELPARSKTYRVNPVVEDKLPRDGFVAKRALQAIAAAVAGDLPVLFVGRPVPSRIGMGGLAQLAAALRRPRTEEALHRRRALLDLAGMPLRGPGTYGGGLRAPHHTISLAGLRGQPGASRPGELMLSRDGVCWFDEAENLPHTHVEAVLLEHSLRRVTIDGHDFLPIFSVGSPPDDADDREMYLRRLRAFKAPLVIDLSPTNVETEGIAGWVEKLKPHVDQARARREARESGGHAVQLSHSAGKDLEAVDTSRRDLVTRVATVLMDIDNADEVAAWHVEMANDLTTWAPLEAL